MFHERKQTFGAWGARASLKRYQQAVSSSLRHAEMNSKYMIGFAPSEAKDEQCKETLFHMSIHAF